jgi:hypothetical protein
MNAMKECLVAMLLAMRSVEMVFAKQTQIQDVERCRLQELKLAVLSKFWKKTILHNQ